MNNNDQEPVIGSSKLKMKIKFSHSSSSPANISSNTQLAYNIKEQNSSDLVIPSLTKSHSNMGKRKPIMNNYEQNSSDPIVPSLTKSHSNMGKRKKKPKKMDDEFICNSPKKIKQNPFLKSDNDVGSIHGSTLVREKNLLSDGVQNHHDEPTRAMIRAEEVQSTLGSEFPSFTKLMVRSNVIKGFWMGVPGNFGREYLPRTDVPFILVDESAREFELNYNGKKMGLSAGWRNFSVEQKLVEDDVLIFQLVEPCKFKVYVIRANDFKDVDGALSLLNLEAFIERNEAEKGHDENKQKAPCGSSYERKFMDSLQSNTLLLKNKKARTRRSVSKTIALAMKLQNGCNTTHPSSSHSPKLETIGNFEDFTVTVERLCLDSELSEDIRAKYYDLCYARNEFLHAHLLEDLNSKLIAGIICQTVNISDTVRTCSLKTSQEDYLNLDKTLESFELLGMSVGFLRKRVSRLVEVAFASEEALEARKYVEADIGRVRAKDEIVNLETKIIELKEASEKYNDEVETLKYKVETHELKLQKEVDAPW